MELLLKLLPTTGTLVFVVVALIVIDRVLQKASKGTNRLRDQLLMIALTAIGILSVILALPISNELRGQILSLIGIILTAAIALSSTTFLGNAMAGIMLNAVRSFRIGDFIEIRDSFGRVTERGLFHTEIQTRERDLVTLPNLYLVTHPVRTVRTSGTIISANVSIGYDAPHDHVEKNLLIGAEKAGLKEPFVQIAELGDFSVSYRIFGLLEEIKQIMTAPSRLRAKVLDSLHEAGIEIVSPTFMNQRVFDANRTFIPEA
ncbi:MAG: mechanosensitive ion channel family protein, partial [Gemmatimonadetes bacterium]|nr:mechanosensitive ion channel family protein [Gemmatimonadota bacterium]